MQTPNRIDRKSFTFYHFQWLELQEAAYALGFRSRNALIVATLKQILADHQQQVKNQDTA
jgi:hypothetical protein